MQHHPEIPVTCITACRACGGQPLDRILDLGCTPVADKLVNAPTAEAAAFPLALLLCPQCHLLQLAHHLSPAAIYNADYPYFSSAIPSLVDNARENCASLLEQYPLDAGSGVVEIASNDGYWLQFFRQRGMEVLGIEPCRPQAEQARDRGIPTMEAFFGQDCASEVKRDFGPTKLLLASNVAAHAPDINDFLSGVAILLEPAGVAILEFHYGGSLLDETQFDTVYHQHVFYFTLTAFRSLAERHGLGVIRVEEIPSYGGSLRVHLSPQRTSHSSVDELLGQEKAAGLLESAPYRAFASRVESIRRQLRALVEEVVARGGTVAGYGAAAKACTLMHACGLDHRLIRYIVDNNPEKQGRYFPGANVPIRPASELERDPPDHMLIFAWNYADEIMAGLGEYRRQGGRFILPIPEPRLV